MLVFFMVKRAKLGRKIYIELKIDSEERKLMCGGYSQSYGYVKKKI